MKQYVITVSKNFPITHSKKGHPTGFIESILAGIKIHTIRSNYEYWKKIADKIKQGKGVLSVRYWSGKAYSSKQVEFAEFSNIEVEKLEFTQLGWFINDIDSDNVTVPILAKNDGLSVEDFKEWFKNSDFSKPMAIIHFTDFRYSNET